MKVLKGLLIFSLIFVFSCSSDDDEPDTTPTTQTISLSIDVADLLALPTLDATSIANFGQANGVSARDFETTMIPGDTLVFKINSSSVTQLPEPLYINYVSGNEEFFNTIVQDTIRDPSSGVLCLKVYSTDVETYIGEDTKYDLEFDLVTNGFRGSDRYFIDPKLKIRDRR